VRDVQRQVVFDQGRDSPVVRRRDALHLAPDEAVVGDEQVCAGVGRPLDGLDGGVDGDGDVVDLA